MNFVTLRAEMKKVCLKYSSALLLIWYVMSVIGFDIHSCMATGESFVTTAIQGVSCEDVHPEHSCDAHGSNCCCHNHHGACGDGINEPECCTNDLLVLEVTGANHTYQEFNPEAFMEPACLLSEQISPLSENSYKHIDCRRGYPDRVGRPDHQAVLSIWRI